MPLLVIVRHGQSVWNLENRFTGETDVDLTALGRDEARAAGKKLKGFTFAHGFTSVLRRAEETLQLILEEIGRTDLPISRNKALNERNYGQLQGMNKAETALKYGDRQVALWRRSYDVRPPGGESLQDTVARVIPYYQAAIEPLLAAGQNILIVAHGNSLRALMMHLEHISESKIAEVDIPTGDPRLYTFDAQLHLEKAAYL
ncbi:MAG: 2,3-bisphosphoglycerate-dependent phosphoglycerate mutase [Bacteroidota bacterium]|nr:2,3-bisphosphoglycerate-dependent phosphoglycerate mutase [Bacteroidota bacterium]MDP4247844.1 2,3-bisphosphoglycerate-dependent phosphoglycerate mutase [Bacteroidota bacterium]MDP4253029.1 2,3-bisphosphoglycerate-dependent phosphoglycerate mutase [Bacteroidota bacterium]MDP4259773.1 2,3-bisphosphoglycerate-dependent phosphoglycerate mutase [Bacteroidota bacterium]